MENLKEKIDELVKLYQSRNFVECETNTKKLIKLNPKVTVVNDDPVVLDSSVTQTSANSSRATNKDYGTGNPFMGLYA